jgi:hypothetical protein
MALNQQIYDLRKLALDSDDEMVDDTLVTDLSVMEVANDDANAENVV